MEDIDSKLKVVEVLEIDEKKLNIINSIKQVIKILFNDKFSNFVLSSAFLYMVYVGIVEEYYLISAIYGVCFFKYTDFRSAYRNAKDLINEYKKKKENINENDLIEGSTLYHEILEDKKNSMIK